MSLEVTIAAGAIRTTKRVFRYAAKTITLPEDSDVYVYFNFMTNGLSFQVLPHDEAPDVPVGDRILQPITKYVTDETDVVSTTDLRETSPMTPSTVFSAGSIALDLLASPLARTDVGDDGLVLNGPVSSTGSAFKANANWALALEAPGVPVEVGDIECSDIAPSQDAAYDIGTPSYRWRSVRAQQLLTGDLVLDSTNDDPALPPARWRIREDPRGIKAIDEITGREYWFVLEERQWQETASRGVNITSGSISSRTTRAFAAARRALGALTRMVGRLCTCALLARKNSKL